MTAMSNEIGLFGREADRRRLLAVLEERSTLLMGPRRVGKTSLLGALQAHSDPQWRFVLVDLQGLTTESEFVKALKRALAQDGLLGALEGVAERIDSVERVIGPVRSAIIVAIGPSSRGGACTDRPGSLRRKVSIHWTSGRRINTCRNE